MSPAPAELSLIVPVLDEAASIDAFLHEIAEAITETDRFEVIFVDDGSTDDTVARILAARQTCDFPIELIELSRNFGKEAAVTAGLDAAGGDAVVPIDVDLQDPPALVNDMLRRWRDGADIVLAIRRQRREDSLAKRLSAELFYRVANLISDTAIPRNAGDFRLMDRRVVNVVRGLRERNRFMKGLLSWPGFRTEAVYYDRTGRAHGQSKWRPGRLLRFALDGIFGFSTLPLRLFTYLGLAVSGGAFVYLGFLVIHTLATGNAVPGYASLASFILFFNGLTLLGIGILGEYIGRIYGEVKARPIYVVARNSLDERNSGGTPAHDRQR